MVLHQSNELEYATKYYAAILARATGKPLEQCQKEYLGRKRYFSVKQASGVLVCGCERQ
jgi:ATP-dependent Clp protease, protease subunit